MKFSTFGTRFSGRSGTRDLMDDLGAVAREPGRWINLGGGNPSVIPAMQPLFDDALADISASGDWASLLGGYDSPQGYQPFIEALADYLNGRFGWGLSPQNIMLTPGSQASFFMLFNLFAGPDDAGRMQRVMLPQSPEYIGYTQSGLAAGQLVSCRSHIELLGERQFRYHIDFDALPQHDIAAICLSRPSNPTGKLATDEEMSRLAGIARAHAVPLIVDSAYGLPFPGIVFAPATLSRIDNTVLCMSLSKLGLPGARTGIVIAHPDIINALTGISAMLTLASNPLGARLGLALMRRHDLVALGQDIVCPHYAERSRLAQAVAASALEGLPWRIHVSEGAIFLWLWFPGLPVSADVLYARLKARGVLVIPGSHFGPGLPAPWPHLGECLRVSYAQREEVLETGFAAIAAEVRAAYCGR